MYPDHRPFLLLRHQSPSLSRVLRSDAGWNADSVRRSWELLPVTVRGGEDGEEVGGQVDELAGAEKSYSREYLGKLDGGAVDVGVERDRMEDVILLEEGEVEDVVSDF